MNQTMWIIGGGVGAVLVAIGLFLSTGNGITKTQLTPEIVSEPAKVVVGDVAETSTSTPKDITQSPSKKMETNTVGTLVVMHTTMGDITVKLYTNDSPKTVANFTKLASEGFYSGVKFHRVIKDFMIQTGDPLSKDDSQTNRWGQGGPGYAFADEFNTHKLVHGSLAMANSGPNSNGSQFFIVTSDATPWLDGKHTNFGEVTVGMDVVMKINGTPTLPGDRPVTPVIINSMEVR